ncbi:hypothetical protein GMMP15_1000006 [Candidatus Magnetomoraceae bacterium gMMP-15]
MEKYLKFPLEDGIYGGSDYFIEIVVRPAGFEPAAFSSGG